MRSLSLPRQRFQCLLLAVALTGCHRADDRAQLSDALARYARLATAMQADSLGAMYAADGRLEGDSMPPVVGPAAIATFLKGFSEYRILRYTLLADSTWVAGDTGFQRGTFAQRVVVPQGDTVSAQGHLAIAWVHRPAGGWRIAWMRTSP